MAQHNYRTEQPERFANAVKACCGLSCSYPRCPPLCTRSFEVEKAVNAWETLPLPNGVSPPDEIKTGHAVGNEFPNGVRTPE